MQSVWRTFRKASKLASIGLAFIAVVALVTRGSSLDALTVPVWVIPIFFYGSAAIFAIVLGILAPYQVGRVRSIGVVILALYPPMIALSLLLYPEWGLSKRLLGVLVAVAAMGIPYGDILWRARGGDHK